MWRALKVLLFLFVVAVITHAQDPFVAGNIYFGLDVYCESKSDAEALAAAYLLRGNTKFLAEEDRKKFHCEVGTILYTVIETVAIQSSDKEVLFVIKVLSNKVLYMISPIPALQQAPSRPSSQEGKSTIRL